MTDGEKCVEAIRAYIAEHGTSWSKLTGDTVAAIIDTALPKAKRTRSSFTPPTPDEVTAYSRDINYPLDGAGWCAGYEAKGWKISGSTRMVDWKAAVRNWKAHGWTLNGTAQRREDQEALGPIPGWELYVEERIAQGLWRSAKPTFWSDLTGQQRKEIHGVAHRIRQFKEFADGNESAWRQHLEDLRKQTA